MSAAEARLGGQFHRLAFTATLIVWAAVLLATNRGWEFTTPARMNGFSEHHFRVARALLATGLGPRGSIICDAAGVIPYVSGFNQIDRVGLVDNYLAGRIPASVEEREQYVWSRPADVYMGFEPPASEGSQTPTDDIEMSTPYVRSLMQRELKLVESRIFLQNPSLLHARMRELRDNWKLLGETDWPGWKAWHLKLFIYVRRDSPNAQVLNQDLGSLIDKPVEQIDLSN